MRKEMPKWKEKSIYEKRLIVLSLILSFLVILFAVISLKEMWQGAFNMIGPLLGLVTIVEALIFWKYNKFVAIFCLIVSLFVLVVQMNVLFFR